MFDDGSLKKKTRLSLLILRGEKKKIKLNRGVSSKNRSYSNYIVLHSVTTGVSVCVCKVTFPVLPALSIVVLSQLRSGSPGESRCWYCGRQRVRV